MKTAIIFNDSGDSITRRTFGAYRIASMMRDLGWNVEVIDWITRWSNEQILLFCKKFNNIDLFAFGNLWMDDIFVIEKIKFLKDNFSNTKYLLGSPKPYQQDFGADVMIFGYAEHALAPTLDWMFSNGELPKGNYPSWAPNSLLIDANHLYTALEIPNYKVDYADNDFILPSDVLTLEMSRGCKFKCKYCSYAFLGIKEDYSRNEESIYNELLDNYKKWGTINYIIADDTFNDRDSKIEKLVNVVKRLPFKVNFSAFIRLDLIISRPQQLELLVKARVWAHFYGVETFHLKAGRAIGKGMDHIKIKEGLLKVKKYFIDEIGLYRGTCAMIAGLPYEPVESWYESLEWLDKNWDCYLFWGLHISTDKDMNTHSLFSKDSEKYGYRHIKDLKILKWIKNNEISNIKSSLTHKLDKNMMFWEADWANFKDAAEFSMYYFNNYFKKITIPNMELLNWWGREDMLDLTAGQVYINKELKEYDYNMIDTYIGKKL